MMRRAQMTAGVLWAVFGIGMLLWDLIEQAPDRFPLSASYYVVYWGVLAGCIIGGVLMALRRPVGHWLALGTAVLVALNELWVLLAYGAESKGEWVMQTAMLITFAVVVAALACKQPNSTVERDGPQAARPSL